MNRSDILTKARLNARTARLILGRGEITSERKPVTRLSAEDLRTLLSLMDRIEARIDDALTLENAPCEPTAIPATVTAAGVPWKPGTARSSALPTTPVGSRSARPTAPRLTPLLLVT